MIPYLALSTSSPGFSPTTHGHPHGQVHLMPRLGLCRQLMLPLAAIFCALIAATSAWAGEAEMILPDVGSETFLGGISGRTLLEAGLLVCFAGAGFGLLMFARLRNLPVHRSMRDISELIYETCKTYLITQGKFILLLELFIGAVMVIYFYWLRHFDPQTVAIIVLFSLIGIAGSYGVAWFGIRINTYANSRAAFASLAGKPYPVYAIPIEAGISIGTLLICVELAIMLGDLAVCAGQLCRALLHRVCNRRIARRGGAAHRGRHLHEDRRHRRGPDENRLQDRRRRCSQSRRDRRLHGRQRRRLGRPDRRRLRNVRRDGRRTDHVYLARGRRTEGTGSIARVDFHDAHHDGRDQRCRLPRQPDARPRQVLPMPTRWISSVRWQCSSD